MNLYRYLPVGLACVPVSACSRGCVNDLDHGHASAVLLQKTVPGTGTGMQKRNSIIRALLRFCLHPAKVRFDTMKTDTVFGRRTGFMDYPNWLLYKYGLAPKLSFMSKRKHWKSCTHYDREISRLYFHDPSELLYLF